MAAYNEITLGWPDNLINATLAGEIQKAISDRQLRKPVTTAGLRALVRQGRWADIGRMFEFEPLYTQIGGKIYFNWTCCTPDFWKLYQPHKWPRKEEPEKSMFRSAKLATKPYPTKKMSTYNEQKGICHYCHNFIEYKQWSIDHLTPLCRGGSNKGENKIGSCKTCNHSKGCLNEREFLLTPVADRKALIKKITKEFLLPKYRVTAPP